MLKLMKNIAILFVKLSPMLVVLGLVVVGFMLQGSEIPWPVALVLGFFCLGLAWDLFRTSYLGQKL